MKYFYQFLIILSFTFLGELLNCLIPLPIPAGTSKATEISELTGAVSSLSLVVAGIFTTIAFSFIA